MISKLKYIFLILVINLFSQINFSNPLSTNGAAPNITPNLSASDADYVFPQIVTDSTGKYVYAVWEKQSTHGIQFSRSNDFGQTWSSANLLSSSNSVTPQIATDETGKYIYVTWVVLGTGNNNVSVIVSIDYGNTWGVVKNVYTPSILPSTQDAYVKTDSTGKNVYLVWNEAGTPDAIKFVKSSDYGVNWTTSSIVTLSGAINAHEEKIQISDNGQNIYVIWWGVDDRIQFVYSHDYGSSFSLPIDIFLSVYTVSFPQIATSSDGKYVYAVWISNDGINDLIQFNFSSNYGVDWSDPATTPGDSPYLSVNGQDSENPQIATSDSGKYVYATWSRKNNGTNTVIQVAISSDYGITWINPLSTTGTNHLPPNLSIDNVNSLGCQLTTNSSGRNVYAVWSSGAPSNIQFAASLDYGASWLNPITTSLSTTSPNISQSGQNATGQEVATNVNGDKVYLIWNRKNDGTHDVIQVSDGINLPYIHFPVGNVSPVGQ